MSPAQPAISDLPKPTHTHTQGFRPAVGMQQSPHWKANLRKPSEAEMMNDDVRDQDHVDSRTLLQQQPWV